MINEQLYPNFNRCFFWGVTSFGKNLMLQHQVKTFLSNALIIGS